MKVRTVDQSPCPALLYVLLWFKPGNLKVFTRSVPCNSAGVLATYNPAKMSATSNPSLNTFNKSKEDFIWFVKRATTDKKSYSHSELYHSLLKMFVDADTNKVSFIPPLVTCIVSTFCLLRTGWSVELPSPT